MGFTIPQEKAIYTRDKSLLVSAAAGSGKTFTLIQRIIESILDEKNPDDISKMLIVTFTNAAVDELRTRVAGALSKKLKELTAQREGGELSEEEAVRLDGRIAKCLVLLKIRNKAIYHIRVISVLGLMRGDH